MVTWRELVATSARALHDDGVPEPEVSASRIGQAATGTEGVEWLEALDRDATKRQLAAFDAMVARRRTGEPLQYVVGGWGFRTLDLFLDRRVLIPRPETEVVAGVAIAEVQRALASASSAGDPAAPVIVVDLGTGSGAIGLSVAAECPGAEVWLTDVSDDAVAVARANLAGLGRRGGSTRVVAGDWFAALPTELAGRVAVVVSNPPYVADDDEIEAQVVEWEPLGALFAPNAGTAHLRHLITSAPGWLSTDGALVLEMAPTQVDAMAALGSEHFDRVDTIVDLAGRDRGLILRRPLSMTPGGGDGPPVA